MVAMPSSSVKRRRLNMSERFDDGDVGDPTAFAHRLQAVTKAARAQAMHESRHELGSARAQWVPKRDRAAVDVELGRVGAHLAQPGERDRRSEEHTSELQSLMRISYAVFCLKKKTHHQNRHPKLLHNV